LEPGLKLLLGISKYLMWVVGMVQQRNLARLLVGNRKSILEAMVAVSELITSPLLQLAGDGFPRRGCDKYVRNIL
jgi:hypothetical protein